MKAPQKLYRCVRRVFPDQATYCEIKPDNKGFTDWVVKDIYVPSGSEKRRVIAKFKAWLKKEGVKETPIGLRRYVSVKDLLSKLSELEKGRKI